MLRRHDVSSQTDSNSASSDSFVFLALADPSQLARASRMVEVLEGFDLPIHAACFPPTGRCAFRSVEEISRKFVGVHEVGRRFFSRKAAYAITVHLPFRRPFRKALDYRYGMSGLLRCLALKSPVLVVTEDIELLPLALDLRAMTGARVLIDVRDFKWDANRVSLGVAHRDHWIYQRRLFETYLAQADAVIAVSDGQRKLMEAATGVHPTVIRSTPNYCKLEPSQPSQDVVKLVYHGKADRERRLELIIEAVGALAKRAVLDLVISHSQRGYGDELAGLATKFANVRILPPVSSSQLIAFANQYDLGLIVYPPSNSNIASALPNKFFEFLQSRLGVVVGPGGDMADIVDTYGCGVVTRGYEVGDIIRALSTVTYEGLSAMKRGAQCAAQELNFETESKKLESLVGNLLRAG
jgi:glycosyltransferase involved in cell wall biosynthesis